MREVNLGSLTQSFACTKNTFYQRAAPHLIKLKTRIAATILGSSMEGLISIPKQKTSGHQNVSARSSKAWKQHRPEQSDWEQSVIRLTRWSVTEVSLWSSQNSANNLEDLSLHFVNYFMQNFR